MPQGWTKLIWPRPPQNLPTGYWLSVFPIPKNTWKMFKEIWTTQHTPQQPTCHGLKVFKECSTAPLHGDTLAIITSWHKWSGSLWNLKIGSHGNGWKTSTNWPNSSDSMNVTFQRGAESCWVPDWDPTTVFFGNCIVLVVGCPWRFGSWLPQRNPSAPDMEEIVGQTVGYASKRNMTQNWMLQNW